MADSTLLALLTSVSCLAAIAMAAFAWRMNQDWYNQCEKLNQNWFRQCEKMNQNWSNHCQKINQEWGNFYKQLNDDWATKKEQK